MGTRKKEIENLQILLSNSWGDRSLCLVGMHANMNLRILPTYVKMAQEKGTAAVERKLRQ